MVAFRYVFERRQRRSMMRGDHQTRSVSYATTIAVRRAKFMGRLAVTIGALLVLSSCGWQAGHGYGGR